MTNKQPKYSLIKQQSDLLDIVSILEKEPSIGVDLEADSMFHYLEKVCLLQISTKTQNILIDPLAIEDMSPLKNVFADSSIRKVFHGADYDIRSLYRDFGIQVNSLFDTQIAARFLGQRELGLASLLKTHFGIIVEKKYQKRDWSKRPLSDAMLSYAVYDSKHLIELSQILEKALHERELSFCMEEECLLLSRVRPAVRDDSPLFIRFKGAKKLDSRKLAILEAILQFRNSMAMQKDRPPFKIMGNAPIFQMVELVPENKNELEMINGFSHRQIKMYSKGLLNSIDEAINLPDNELPKYPEIKRQGNNSNRRITMRVKAFKSWREQRAAQMGVDSPLVCTNIQIQTIASVYPKNQEELKKIDGIKAWQIKLFGKDICDLLKSIG
jgi:ribonuclease D